ncbi:hypothetical protein [Shinella lacus]|uniref:Uncharacterized protein n=1 Tax=Shinella lacus TaxID=2654216 RepID=A0ABT1RB73_9HYPH|nr:hypothetical protein [Shinella lacus]MCQ4632443.1 hypothetical protein [Shinella lacus]
MGNWRPTGGKDTLLDARLNTGSWNGKPIYIHVTSQEGHTGIDTAGKINATPKKDRRGPAAKNGIYLNPVQQTFCPSEAFTLLFFEEEKYRNSATHCFVFSFLKQPGASSFKEDDISNGSWVKELIYFDNITYSQIDILYKGPNPFAALRLQNHPNPKVQAAFG